MAAQLEKVGANLSRAHGREIPENGKDYEETGNFGYVFCAPRLGRPAVFRA